MSKRDDMLGELRKLSKAQYAEELEIRKKYEGYKITGFDCFPGNAELRELDKKYKGKYSAIFEKYKD